MSRALRLQVSREIVLDRCVSCGVEYGVTDDFDAQRRKDKQTFYCPNGHPLSYRESEADKLRRELQIAQQQIARVEDEKRREVEAQITLRRAAENKLRLQTKRVSAGVCPCCNHTFQQLARHMANKHPEIKNA